MKTLLKLEEAAQFLACLFLLFKLDSEWWWYLLLVLGPDIGMLGYLVNARIGAVTYNLLHHKGIALLPFAFALCVSLPDTHMGDRYFGAGVLTASSSSATPAWTASSATGSSSATVFSTRTWAGSEKAKSCRQVQEARRSTIDL